MIQRPVRVVRETGDTGFDRWYVVPVGRDDDFYAECWDADEAQEIVDALNAQTQTERSDT